MPEVKRQAPAGEQHVQSVIFVKEGHDWTEESCRTWLKDHDYYTDGLDEADTEYRWRQYDPQVFRFKYRRIQLSEDDGIDAILGVPK